MGFATGCFRFVSHHEFDLNHECDVVPCRYYIFCCIKDGDRPYLALLGPATKNRKAEVLEAHQPSQ